MIYISRPRKEIDQKTFEKLCGLQCTLHEISSYFECSSDTIERWSLRTYKKPFAEVFAEKRSHGKISLRRMQFQLAERNASMAIFLGKNYLGQSDVAKVQVMEAKDDVADELERYFKEGQTDGDCEVLPTESS